MLKLYVKVKRLEESIQKKLVSTQGELGMGTLIAIAVAIIVAAFVMIPGLKDFSKAVLKSMNDWWTNTVQTEIFPTS